MVHDLATFGPFGGPSRPRCDRTEHGNLSIQAFRLGERAGRRTGSIPALASGVRNAVGTLASRSIKQNRFSRRNPSTGSVRFRPTWSAPWPLIPFGRDELAMPGENDLYVTVVKDPNDSQAKGGIVRIANVK